MDVDALLSTDAASGRVALAARVALSQTNPAVACPRYFGALERALIDEPPPFDTVAYADLYHDASASWRWMAVSLITNAEREGDGAKRLWSLAACSDEEEIQRLLKQHAVDESRHALLYLALLDLTFPEGVDPSFRQDLDQLSPHYSLKQDLVAVEGSPYAKKPSVDDFLQMNIAEIRTAIHHIMQRPAITRHCSADKQKPITAIQDSLLRDELRHIAYTAALIERMAGNLTAEKVASLFRRRFHDFNQITRDELGEGAFDCSVSCCAKHQGCRSKVPSMTDGVLLEFSAMSH